MRSQINYLSTLTRINLSGFSRNVFSRRDILLFLALCGTWSLLYLPHLRTFPSCHEDEGLALCAGLNLVSGIPAHGSFWNTFWNHYAPYQPFYELAIGGMAQLFGGNILGGRIFNACIGLAASLVICFYGRRIMPWNESFVCLLPQSLQGRLSPRIAYWTTQSCEEVAAAAQWINERTSPKDLVICHQNIAWLIHARTADYLQVASWMGLSTWPFKNPLPKAQFRFEPDLAKAKFAIIGDIDQRWTILQPNIAGIMKPLTDGSWKLVWRGENYYIFENPDLRLLPR